MDIFPDIFITMGELIDVLFTASRREIGLTLISIAVLIGVIGAVARIRSFSFKLSGLIFLIGLLLAIIN